MKKLILLMVIMGFNFSSCGTKKTVSKAVSLEGKWELNFITGPRIAFDGLYPDKKPIIVFDLQNKKIAGNNGCNQYFGALILDGQKINFKDAKIGMTMMACQGKGDALYMESLKKVERYTISDDGETLYFKAADIEIMRFSHLH